MNKYILLLFSVLLFVPHNANALVVDIPDGQFMQYPSNFGYFKDEITGYIWMDVDNYEIPYDTIEAALASSDFHLATLTELQAMQSSAGTNFTAIQPIIGDSITTSLAGVYDDGNKSDGVSVSSLRNDNPSWQFFNNAFSSDYSEQIGAWIVNTDPNTNVIPEPVSFILFSSGMAGMFLKRKRFNN